MLMLHRESIKKRIPKFRGPCLVKAVLPNDRYLVTDIEGFQATQVPYEKVIDPCKIKPLNDCVDIFFIQLTSELLQIVVLFSLQDLICILI